MPLPDNLLQNAMAAHKAGRLAEAEAGYRQVLDHRPRHPKALYYLALLHFHRGDSETALQVIAQCLEYAPTNPHAWNTFGGMLVEAGRHAEAREAYRKVTQHGPALGEGWYNLGICLRDDGDLDGAIAALGEAITRQADYFRAYEVLAALFYQLGQTADAAEIYRKWAAVDPSSAKARHMAAATSNENVPGRASDEYIQSLFDSSAKEFDANLEQLGYRAPRIVAAALARFAPEAAMLDVLDAGCGTGLCGPLIRERCRSLVGVDLSERMLHSARSRGGYDELVVAELSAFMRSRPESFDAIICADTLVYFGALDEPLLAARATLRKSGLLIFTLEVLSDAEQADHRLESHGRYTHSEAYVRRVLAATGFELHALERETLRQERLLDVVGYLVVARRE